ncbi:hypothetical protein AMECASPLE_027697 [Ameca splendens]|uniref:Uncharacterized protein n=1 Tax=Ameca splendens TaxID=208324 RepID=A0ABV0YGM9_9TELE
MKGTHLSSLDPPACPPSNLTPTIWKDSQRNPSLLPTTSPVSLFHGVTPLLGCSTSSCQGLLNPALHPTGPDFPKPGRSY